MWLLIKAWIAGTIITFVALAAAFILPGKAFWELLLKPTEVIANAMPGGAMHNPLAIPFALGIQGLLVGIPIAAFLFSRRDAVGSN